MPVVKVRPIMKRKVFFRLLGLLSTAAWVVWAGCGYDNGLKLARVSGRVTYKGEPVKNGTVFFLPDESQGTIGPSATASLRDDGTYSASTDFPGDGVIIGSHKIGLTALESASPASAAGPEPEKEAPGSIQAKAKSAALPVGRANQKQKADLFTDSGGRKYRYVLPKKLGNPNESGISAKIDSGSNTLNFDIDAEGQVKVSH
jgi:hypothetical protein